MREAMQLIWAQARLDTSRFLLTLSGIVLASATAVFLASVLHGAGVGLAGASQKATGDDVTRITSKSLPWEQRVRHGSHPLSQQDAVVLGRHEKLALDKVAASMKAGGKKIWVGQKSLKVTFQSGGKRAGKLVGLQLLHGRWPKASERGQRLCVVGYKVWNKLLGGSWPLKHSRITLEHVTQFRVVGVLKTRPMLGSTSNPSWTLDYRVWVSNDVFRASISPRDGMDEIVMRHTPGPDGALPDRVDVALGLSPLLLNLHQGLRNYQFDALRNKQHMDKMIVAALAVILIGSSLIAMIVGGINVMNAQLVTLHEKTKEYAIERAVGLSARALRRRVLVESLVMTGLGTVVGIVAGLGVAWGISLALTKTLMPWPFRVVWWSIGATVMASAFSGLLAGWVPAKRAATIPVAESLREG